MKLPEILIVSFLGISIIVRTIILYFELKEIYKMKIKMLDKNLNVPKIIIFKKRAGNDIEKEYKFVKMLNPKVAVYKHEYISTRTGVVVDEDIRYLEGYNMLGRALYYEQVKGIKSNIYQFIY